MHVYVFMHIYIYISQKDDAEDVNGRKKEYKVEVDLSTAPLLSSHPPFLTVSSPKSGLTPAWLASNSTCT